MAKAGKKQNRTNGANLGFEATTRAAADKLRGNMDAAEYKRVVLGPSFLSTSPMRSKNTTRGSRPKKALRQEQ